MAKTKISEYDVTAGNNTDINSINIDEGCSPSGINNAIRALMSHLKNWQSGVSGDTLPIASGGTGATTAGAARTALSAASTGANSDITSLTGLTTALSTIQGGTGVIQKSISNVARTSNVVTITTSTAHGFTAGHYVTIAAVTNTSLNGTFLIATVGSTTFTYAQTASDLTSVADTGTALDITYCNLVNNITGTLPVANGGTGVATITSNAVVLGNGTSAVTSVAPSTSGNILTSNGTTWTSVSPVIPWVVSDVSSSSTITTGTTSYSIASNTLMVLGTSYHYMAPNIGSSLGVRIKNSSGTTLFTYTLTGGNEGNGTDGGSGMSSRAYWTVAIPSAAIGGTLEFYRIIGSQQIVITINQVVKSQ